MLHHWRFRKHDLFRLKRGLAGRLLERHFTQHAFFTVEREAVFGSFEILGQHVDKKAQRADVLGDVLQRRRFQFRVAFGRGQGAHGFLHVQRGAHGVFLVQDRDRALQLVQHRVDLAQGRTLGAVRIVIVEHLLDLAQAVFHLGGQHRDGVVLLDLARQVALPLRRVRRSLSGGHRQQALTDDRGVRIEVLGQLANLVQAMLDEQHGAGHLQAEHLVAARRDRILGGLDQLVLQPGQRRSAQLFAGGGDAGQLLFEFGFLGGIDFSGQLVPGDLGARQRFLGGLERFGVDAAVALLVVVGRHHVVHAVGAAQCLGGRRWVAGRGDKEQGVAHHRLGQAALALRQTPDLQVDQAEQLLDIQVAGQLALGDQFGERLHRHPEGARGAFLLAGGDQRDRLLHHLRGGLLGGGVGAFQERQQRFLEAPAASRVVRAGGRGRMLRQHGGKRQVREEQVGRMDPGRADFFLQLAIIREQARRLLDGAGQQFFEVLDDRLVHRTDGFCILRAAGKKAVAEAVERLLGRLGHDADTVDIDHLQSPVGLVQVRFRMLE